MGNSNISFYGYNDGKAIEIYNSINLFIPMIITFVVSFIFTILSVVFHNYYLLVIWVIPVILSLVYVLSVSFTKYNDKVFLKGTKKKHSFVVENGNLIKDGKMITKDKIKVYEFKNYVFLISKNSYYRVPNEEFVGISREEFICFIKK